MKKKELFIEESCMRQMARHLNRCTLILTHELVASRKSQIEATIATLGSGKFLNRTRRLFPFDSRQVKCTFLNKNVILDNERSFSGNIYRCVNKYILN